MLEAEDVSVSYGSSIVALESVSVTVRPGDRVALLGPNGAGKTTLVRALSGALALYGARLTSGEIRLGGNHLRMARPAQGIRRGIAAIPEGRAIIGRLSVYENLVLGASALGKVDRDQLDLVLDAFPVLKDRIAQSAGFLSGGEQQMLAIGRALMAKPSYLIADELSLGLAPLITEEILRRLMQLNHQEGLAVLLVEQNARRALTFAEHAYLMVSGKITRAGDAESLLASGIVEKEYLGMENQ